MKRDYSTGSAEGVTFFVGNEVEHTPAYGQKTLFVTGVQPVEVIEDMIKRTDVTHIFFGANHSFKPESAGEWQTWEKMIEYFLKLDMLCSLDIPLSAVEEFNDGALNDYNNFIPQIRVPIPYLKLWNYNTMIKIDDKDFSQLTPGVWSHSLHSLTSRTNFTPWSDYKGDIPL